MSKVNTGQAPSTLIPKYIGSDFDKVVSVADNIEQVVIVGDNIEDVGTVADNINYVKEVAEDLHGMPVTMYTGENPPVLNPMPEGVMWYCTTDGRTYVWYTDADSGQWVESAPQSAMKDEATNIFLHSVPSNVNPAYRSATLYSIPAPEAEISVAHNALNTPVVQAQFIREEALWVDVSVIGAQGIVTLMAYSSGNSQLKAEIITWKNGAEGTSLGTSQWVTLPNQPSVVSLPVTLANIDVLDAGDSYVVKLTSQMNAGGSAVSTILVDGNTSSRFGIIFNTNLIGLNDGIRDGVTTSAPTENAVYDALQQLSTRSELAAPGGAGLIGGLAKPVTWSGFAGGADDTGVVVSDAAFAAAASSGDTVIVPAGIYNLSVDTPYGSWIVHDGASFTGAGKLIGNGVRFDGQISDYGFGKGKRWVSDTPPVKIHRFRDRVFVGGSANNSGGISNQGANTTSWLDDPAQTGLNVGNASLEQNSTLACATESGLGGAVFASRASDYGLPTGGTIGLTSLVLNDKDTTVIGGRPGGLAHYSVAVLSENANSNSGYSVTGTESNLWNQKLDASSIDPYNFFPTNLVKNIWLSNGFPENEHSRQSFDSTCAIGVLNNVIDATKAKYKVGIAFKATSLAGTDGVTGRGIAMSLARGHSFQWYLPNGAQGPHINSSVDSSANEVQALVFTNFGTQILNGSNQKIHFLASSIPVVNNYPKVIPSVSGSAVRYAVEGDDANIDLQLVPKGTGVVRIGTSIVPNVDNTRDFGTAALRGRTAYFGTGTINTSDERHKPIIESITDELLDAWGEVEWFRFKFDDAIAEKGADGARWHFGLVAQRVRDVLDAHGIDGFSLGLLCYDKWDDVYEQILQNEVATTTRTREIERPVMTTRKVTRVVDGVQTLVEEETPQLKQIYVVDDNGAPVFNDDGTRKFEFAPVMETVFEEYEEPDAPIYESVLVLAAGDRYGIRYEEALSLEAVYQRRNYQRLLSRIEALEVK